VKVQQFAIGRERENAIQHPARGQLTQFRMLKCE
jgi:hypothetical protein